MAPKITKTSKNLGEIIWESVLEKFSNAKTQKEVESFFDSLITSQERENIARRLAVLSLVDKGLHYREIGEKLWVSPVTISTIKKSILSRDYKSHHQLRKERSVLANNNIENKFVGESAFSQWLDHISFLIENAPQINGPRWRFLRYNPTLPKKYRHQ